MNKPRAASRVPRSHSAPPIRIPIFFAHTCGHEHGSQTHMIKATRCFARPALTQRSTHSHPDLFCAFCAKNFSMLMCGRSENVRKCSSELGICGRFPRCFNHSAQKISLCSCVGARKCPQDRICGAYPSLPPLARCLFIIRHGGEKNKKAFAEACKKASRTDGQ